MNFRRQPFQFTTIDPVKRQAELQKRFGLPTTNSEMFVDFLNPGIMGSGIKKPSLGGSPRLQHRVPIFTEKAAKDNSEQNVDSNHKPRVRVIPIQVEGVDGGKRHRTFSGPAGISNGDKDICKGKLQESFPHLDSSELDEKPKGPSQPRVCNIPIQIEPREVESKVDSNAEPREKKPSVNPSPAAPEPVKKLEAEPNGCGASRGTKEEPYKSVPLKQIEVVLNKLKLYTEEVEKFSGTSKDKQYRYLDEMLTRCMLDLDNVDTMGLDEIRKARKEAVRQVQHYVDLLDTKVNEPVEKMDSDSSLLDTLIADSEDEQMVCDVPTEIKDDTKDASVSSDMNKTNITGDVEMAEEKSLSESVPEVAESISTQDCENEEVVDCLKTEDENMSPIHATDCEMKDSNKSGIVIEELDDGADVGTSEIGGNGSVCVISDSPELNVKDTIIEECESEVVIEEVEDSGEKNIEHSINACDSSNTNISKGVTNLQRNTIDSKEL